jgi:hypothetical protein
MAGRSGGGVSAEEQRRPGLEEEDKDQSVILQKCKDLTVMSW